MSRMIYHAIYTGAFRELYERQWIQSVRSIRKYNPTIPIYLYLYGETSDLIKRESLYNRVIVIHSSYEELLGSLALPEFVKDVIKQYPVIHKFAPLRQVPSGMEQVLYLDCDTFLFENVDNLFSKYTEKQFYAREEPNTQSGSLSVLEAHMMKITSYQGLGYLPLYNMGVCLFNKNAWETLNNLNSFYTNLYRFMMNIYQRKIDSSGWNPIIPYGTPLEYPPIEVIQPWIVEQVALWYTWGGTGVTHGKFARRDIKQSAEEYIFDNEQPILTHYFHLSEYLFFERVDRITEWSLLSYHV